jgi:hypothetical protein
MDKLPDPVIRFLCAQAAVEVTNALAKLIEQASGFEREA